MRRSTAKVETLEALQQRLTLWFACNLDTSTLSALLSIQYTLETLEKLYKHPRFKGPTDKRFMVSMYARRVRELILTSSAISPFDVVTLGVFTIEAVKEALTPASMLD